MELGLAQVVSRDGGRFKDTILALARASREIPFGTKPDDFNSKRSETADELFRVGAGYVDAQKGPVIITERGERNPFVDYQFNIVRYAAIRPGADRVAIAFDGRLNLKHFSEASLEEIAGLGVEKDVLRNTARTPLLEFYGAGDEKLFALEKDRLKVGVGAVLDHPNAENTLEAVTRVTEYIHDNVDKALEGISPIHLHRFTELFTTISPQLSENPNYIGKMIRCLDEIARNGIDSNVVSPLSGKNVSGREVIWERARMDGGMSVRPEMLGYHLGKIVFHGNGRVLVQFDSEIDRNELRFRLGNVTEQAAGAGEYTLDLPPQDLRDDLDSGRLQNRIVPSYLLRNTQSAGRKVSLEGDEVVLDKSKSIAGLTRYGVVIPSRREIGEDRQVAIDIAEQIQNQLLLKTYTKTGYHQGVRGVCALDPLEISLIKQVYTLTKNVLEVHDVRTRPSEWHTLYAAQKVIAQQLRQGAPVA